jgi:hypothetical protein
MIDTAPAAGVAFFDDAGAVLLMKRPNGEWGFPAGSIENGETSEQAARREVFEETGYALTTPLVKVGDYENLCCFTARVGKFGVTLNNEHSDADWFDLKALPLPLHRATAIICEDAYSGEYAMDRKESARQYDINGWFEVQDNPLSKVGVFPYLGKNIPQEAEKGNHTVMFQVYRPAEELEDPDCIASFRLTPWIIDHTMLGDGTGGTVQVEEKGARGVTGEQIWFDPYDGDGTLKGNIKCFSEILAGQIAGGKTPLSLGYRCVYEYAPGIFNGIPYTYVQRRIRGNHLASVDDGRMGPEVAVLDGFSFTVDAKEFVTMATKKVVKPVPKKNATAVAVLRARMQAFAMDAEEKIEKGEDKDGELAAAVKAISDVAPLLEAVEDLKCVGADEDLGTVAGDTMQSPGDERTKDANGLDAEESDEDKAKRLKKEKEGKGEDGKGMDAAEVGKMIQAAVAAALSGKGMDAREVVHTIASRDKLAEKASEFVGTFDASEMTAQQVAEYVIEKKGIPAKKGSEVAAVEAWLHDRPSPRTARPAFAGDAKDRANKPSFMSAAIAERS